MKIHFLGTNGWYSSPSGDTPCVLVEGEDRWVIFDAGNGLYKINDYIKDEKPISLFISHFHIDHVSGLHTLAKFNFNQGIDVYVAAGRKADFETLVNPPFTIGFQKKRENIHDLRTDIRLHELEEGDHDIGFPVSVAKLYHAYDDHCFRIQLDGVSITYSGDTKRGPRGEHIARDSDILIHECSNIHSPDPDEWGHTDPVQTAQFARDMSVGRLILTHFAADQYDTLQKRMEAQERAQKIFSETISATDGLTIAV